MPKKKVKVHLPWKRLYVSEKLYSIMCKSKRQGIKNLERLIDREKEKESWFYSYRQRAWHHPSSVKHSTEIPLYDGTMAVLSFYKDNLDLSRLGQYVSHYTIHPKHLEEKEKNRWLSNVEKEIINMSEHNEFIDDYEAFMRQQIPNIAAVNISLPSIFEVFYAIDTTKMFPNAVIDFNVVSPYGILNYVFPDKDNLYGLASHYDQFTQLEHISQIVAESKGKINGIKYVVQELNLHMDGKMQMVMHYRQT